MIVTKSDISVDLKEKSKIFMVWRAWIIWSRHKKFKKVSTSKKPVERTWPNWSQDGPYKTDRGGQGSLTPPRRYRKQAHYDRMYFINMRDCVHDNNVNNIYEYNLLHDILNPSKFARNIKSHYSPILHGCTNTFRGKAKFNICRILLYIVCSSMILVIIEKANNKT